MSGKRYLCIRNFDELQHYKERNPIWIKLHCSLLDDYEFAGISDETKFHAVGLMLLASRLNNKFPDDERWLRQKINANSEINLKLLLEIEFLEVVKEENAAKKAKKMPKKKPTMACKSMKTQDRSASTTFKTALAQKRTEENRREENTTEHNRRADENAPDAQEVVVCDFSKSSKTESGEADIKKSAADDHRSEFSIEECLRYVQTCVARGDEIRNPQGLARNLFETGKADAFIRATLYPEKQAEVDVQIYGAARKFTRDPCAVCFGAKMADADGKGFRACDRCKNERGKSTGFEPEGVGEDENKN